MRERGRERERKGGRERDKEGEGKREWEGESKLKLMIHFLQLATKFKRLT